MAADTFGTTPVTLNQGGYIIDHPVHRTRVVIKQLAQIGGQSVRAPCVSLGLGA